MDELQNYVDRISSVKAGSLMNYLLSELLILTGIIFKQIFELPNYLIIFLQGVQNWFISCYWIGIYNMNLKKFKPSDMTISLKVNRR